MQTASNADDRINHPVGLLYFLLMLLLLGVGMVSAKDGPEPVVNFARYQSLSGNYSWEIDPTDPHGRGVAAYQVKKGGQLMWSGKLPFTFHEAAVAEDGSLAGYAYTFGYRGYPRDGDGSGEFIVAIIRPNGELKLKESIARTGSRFLHTPPNPLADGLFLNDFNDRFVVRVDNENVNERIEHWWTYQISSGKLQGKYAVSPPGGTYVLKARVVSGTPLTLVHYWRYVGGKAGARFALLDEERREAWSLTLAGDYQVPGNEKAEDNLRFKVRAEGAILDTSHTNTFAIWSAASNERIEFSVARDKRAEKGWLVKEVSRIRRVEPDGPSPQLQFSGEGLKSLGSFKLQSGVESLPAVRDISHFSFDESGHIGVLRQDDSRHYTIMYLKADGTVLREKPLPVPAVITNLWNPRLIWLKADQWLVTMSATGIGTESQGWWFDAGSGELSALTNFTCPSIEATIGARDGGFVVLGTIHRKYSMEKVLIAYDANAKVRWQLKQDTSAAIGSLFSPEDVTVLRDGTVVVLDVIRHTLQYFDAKGTYLKMVDLAKSWKLKPGYTSRLMSDDAGNLAVNDFGEPNPIVRMRTDGTFITRLEAQRGDGRKLESGRNFALAPTGELWASDRASLMRLGTNGVVDFTIGSEPDPNRLEKITALTVDQKGRLYAVDRRTSAIHVFDASGRRLQIFNGAPGRLPKQMLAPNVAADQSGTVYLGDEFGYPKRAPYLTYDTGNSRVQTLRLDWDEISQNIKARADGFLVLGYTRGAVLLDAQQKELRTITRRPDNKWLISPDDASVAANGSFAIISQARDERDVSLYDAAGEPVRVVSLPAGWDGRLMAYTGKQLIVALGNEFAVFDAAGRPLAKFDPGLGDLSKEEWMFATVNNDSELWWVSLSKQVVHRYGLPQQ